MRTFPAGLTAMALALGLGQGANAACPADGATPFTASPVLATNGFSEYLQDSEGLALELCLDPASCLFDPPQPNVPFSVAIGFGAEAFWWLAENTVTTPVGLDALIVMAAEAAFLTETPAVGEQFPFTRLRIRIDVPVPGIYTVIHPFGEERFVVQAVGAGQEVRESFDIEFTPDAVNQGRVGPWLTWDATPPAPPPGFIGDAATPHRVQGSPCGNNLFRVEAVALDGVTPINIDPQDLDNDGKLNGVQSELFTVSGKVFQGNVLTPLVVTGTHYSRTAAGATRVNVFATGPTAADVTCDICSQPLAGDGTGRFFASELLTGPPPTTVQVTAANPSNPNNLSNTITSALDDVVTILQADYEKATGTLTIAASSSDEATPAPALAADGFGNLTGGTLTVTGLAVAPATVTVRSVVGGEATEPVRVINP